jgi:hypothetical protein
MMLQSIAALALGALALVMGCSSIPDVTFTDAPLDGGSDGSSAASGEGGSPTTTSGGTSGTSGAPAYSCPSNPPPRSAGICCNGARVCLNCNPSVCSKCQDANCSNGDVCCGRQDSSKVDCRKPSDC